MTVNKRLLQGIFSMIAAFLLTLAISHGWNDATPLLPNGSTLPKDIDNRQYTLSGLATDAGTGNCVITLYPSGHEKILSLVLTDASDCIVYQGEEVLYTYHPDDIYQRVILIPLNPVSGSQPLTLRISSSHLRDNFTADITGGILPRFKIAIGESKLAERSIQISTAVNSACCGMYMLIIIVSFALYIHKTSEKYLIMIALASFSAFIAALLTSSFPSINITQGPYLKMRSFVVILPLVPNAAFALYLIRGHLDRRISAFLRLDRVLLATAAALLIQAVSPINMYHIDRWLLYFPTVLGLLIASKRKDSDANLLIIGATICEALHFYVYLVNSLRLIPAGLPILYTRFSQPGYLINHILGMYVICRLYARKFSESQNLSKELTMINQNLDRIVEKRTHELKLEQEQRHGLMLNVFHDLRTPIFVMRGCLSSLSESSELDTETKKNLSDRLSVMERLVEDLFLVAKLETDELPFDFDVLDLSRLASSVAEGYDCLASDRSIALHTHIMPGMTIWGDRIRMEQVIQNLINNAFHHTPAQGEIVLSVFAQEDNVVLTVQDNGYGISSENLPHIFERYYRIPGDGADNHSFGLGLSIVREIVQAHRGTITATSTLHHGTCFTLHFKVFHDVRQ